MYKAEILIVDDVTANLDVVSQILEDANYETVVALDGKRALKLVNSNPPDLILLDIQMPGLDGFEICQRLKNNPETAVIPVIFMTALSDIDSKVKGFDLGAVDYISKPFQEKELLARVKTHLSLQALKKDLEDKVADRTAKLQKTLEELENSRLQLVQQEKMSALGKLVAGIAHEINNPVNFIHGNLHCMNEHASDLLSLSKIYQAQSPEVVSTIEAQIEDLNIDVEFIRQDLPRILDSMKVGTERIRQIVLSLRNFSRTDEVSFKTVDLHEGIESTLLLLEYRLKTNSGQPKIQIVRHYGDLPLIECDPGKLNQVFMNILTNAIDALEAIGAQQEFPGTSDDEKYIKIQTCAVDSEWVKVSISDNGIGMSPSVRTRLFEPFFTTKPMGKGTGMGMPISYQIINDQHSGTLECFSVLGEGTEFVIQLPIHSMRK